MTRTITRLNFDLKFGGRLVSNADFADDLALLIDTPEELVAALTVMREETSKVRCNITWSKTKIVHTINNHLNHPLLKSKLS
jgi:hypothetical protein